jgi:hypothetical protein
MRRDRLGWRVGALAGATAVLYLVLVAPNHPAALSVWALRVFPLELPVIVLMLLALPARGLALRAVQTLLVTALTLVTVLKLADFATFVAYNRGFNPLVDWHLVAAAWHFGSGSAGVFLASVTVLVVAGAILGLAALLWWATGTLASPNPAPVLRGTALVAIVPCTALAVAEIGDAMGRWDTPFDPPGAAFTARVAVERVDMVSDTLAGLIAFQEAATNDAFADTVPLLDAIGDRDVLLLFIESYGASSLTNPRYAPTHLPTLNGIEASLSARGLAMRSGWLEAPMIGGQSWLSHATLSTGLWVPDQRAYGAALQSDRRSLFHIAQDNGFATAAVMPAITMDWPEAAFMGFDRVLPAATLGYQGLPFNWVTMPDQFTLAALDRLVLPGAAGRDRAPVFAQVALISSHAPWTPVPDLVAWEDLADGRIFDAVAVSGDPPDVVWRDHDRVRDQFRQAVDYSLRTVGAYAERHADDAPLMIVMGDHQPARFVSEDDSLAVPIHVIGPPDLVARIADWGWRAGMVPEMGAEVLRMDAFRNRFLTAFSGAAR